MNRLKLLSSLLLLVFVLAPLSRADELSDHAHSLRLVPRDAAFYTSSMKLGRQMEIVADSNWWQRVQQVPVLQLGIVQIQQAWMAPPTPELQQAKDWMESDQGKKVMGTLKEMMSDEIFMYADSSSTELLELMLAMQSQMNQAQLAGGINGVDPEEALGEFFVEFLREHKAELKMPNFAMGFRIRDNATAGEHIETLETLLVEAMKACPVPLDEHFERKANSDMDLLVLEMPSSMIPWEDVEAEIEEPELYELLRDVMDGKSMTVAVGRVGEFMVMSVGNSIEHIEEWGTGETLDGHPAIKRLAAHADQELVAIEFVNGDFLKSVSNTEQTLRDWADMAKTALEQANITEDDRKQIANDIDKLKLEMIDQFPEVGDVSAVTFLTPRGYEEFTYNFAEQKTLDSSKPLTLAGHIGSNPAAFMIGRGSASMEEYDTTIRWGKIILRDVETIAVSEADPEQWAEYLQVKSLVMPFLERMDKVNREHLIPGFADGQSGMLLDFTVAEANWCEFMSPAKKPLPMPSITLTMGVSDASAVNKGMQKYHSIVQDIMDKAHELEPDEFPEIELPVPSIDKEDGVTKYEFELDSSLGVSPQIAPYSIVSDSIAAFGYMPQSGAEIVAGSSFSIDSPVADFDRPLAAAFHVNFNAMLDAAKPWIDYGFQYIRENDLDESNMAFFVRPQLDQCLELTRVLRSATGVTYYEDGAWVTRTELHLKDLD